MHFVLLVLVASLVAACGPLSSARYAMTDPRCDIECRTIREGEARVRSNVRITYFKRSSPNSVGGVDIRIDWKNTSQKTVKYAHFTVSAYNAVGDPAICEIKQRNTFRLEDVGPVRPGQPFIGNWWRTVLYNSSTKYVILDEIDLEYMDGSRFVVKGNEVKYGLDIPTQNVMPVFK